MAEIISIDTKSQRILDNLKFHAKKAEKGAIKGLWFVGRDVINDIKSEIKDKEKKTGRVYVYKGRTHIASAAGEYPANRSGSLRKSMGFEVKGLNLEIGARDSIDYGKYLEKGTKRMRPRPYIDRTFQKNRLKSLDIIGKEIEKEIKKR